MSDINIYLDDAINRGELDEVKALVSKGADIECRDPLGNTPLMSAAWVAAVDVVEFLLEQGADICAVNKEGLTALEMAQSIGHNEYGHDAVVRILEAARKAET